MIFTRNFADSEKQDQVSCHYKMMRINHTLKFADKMAAKYDFSDGKHRAIMTVSKAFDKLLTYVSNSVVFLL